MVPTWGFTELLGMFHPVPPLLATQPSHQVHGSYMEFHRPTRMVPPSSSSPSNSTFSPGTWFLHGIHRPAKVVPPSSSSPSNSTSHQVHCSYMWFNRPNRVVPPSYFSPSNSTFSPGTWFLHGATKTYQGGSTLFLFSQQVHLLTGYMVPPWGSTDLPG